MDRSIILFIILAFMTGGHLQASPENTGTAYAGSITTMTGMADGTWRWRDVAGYPYSGNYQLNYSYTTANVTIAIDDNGGRELTGHLSATGLKPNFAYQLKLNEWDLIPRDQYERIGYRGRWWQEEWNGTGWTNGHNLNIKTLTGLLPYQNQNDKDYDDRKDVLYTGGGEPSPNGGLLYKYSTYRVFAYFITDGFGAAEVDFAINSSFHVLWKTVQRTRTMNDGIVLAHDFDPDPDIHTAYDTDHAPAWIGVFGEWERLPNARVELIPGTYDCQFALAEETFHEAPNSWALAMLGDVAFTILPNTLQSSVSQTAPTIFADTEVGGSSDLILDITNTGNAALSLLGWPSASVASGDVGEFSIVSQPTDVLVMPNASTTMTVRYTPTAVGDHTVTLQLPTNDPDNPTFDVVLSGTAVSSNASLTGNTSFPTTYAGVTRTQTYVIRNKGAVDLTLTGAPVVSLVGDSSQFSVATTPPTVIPPGGAVSFEITFRPTRFGSFNVELVIPCDDPQDPTLSLFVSGSAILYDSPDRDDWRDPGKCGLQSTESPIPFYVLLSIILLMGALARRRLANNS